MTVLLYLQRCTAWLRTRTRVCESVYVCVCVCVCGNGSSDLDANVTTDRILFQSQVARAVIPSVSPSPSLRARPSTPSSLSLAIVQVPEDSRARPVRPRSFSPAVFTRSSPQILPPGTDAAPSRTFLSRPAATTTVSPNSSVSFLIQFPDRRQLAHWTTAM